MTSPNPRVRNALNEIDHQCWSGILRLTTEDCYETVRDGTEDRVPLYITSMPRVFPLGTVEEIE